MQPDLRREETRGTSHRRRDREKFHKALDILTQCYNQIVAELADQVCEEEELLAGGAGFTLSELENKYANRLRDLQALICSLRDFVSPQQPRPANMDELHCTRSELSAVLSDWIDSHSYADIVQILLNPVDDNDIRVLPIYYGD